MESYGSFEDLGVQPPAGVEAADVGAYEQPIAGEEDENEEEAEDK